METSILTVTDPAESFDLTTIDALKSELDTDLSDSVLLQYIRQASGQIATHLKRVLAYEGVSEQFRLICENDTLILSRTPVITIDSIEEAGTTLAGTDYEVDSATGLLYRLSGDELTTWSRGKIVVAYSGGYELLGNLPYDIERACLMLCKIYISLKDQSLTLRSESVDGLGSQSYFPPFEEGGLPPEVTSLISPYRRVLF